MPLKVLPATPSDIPHIMRIELAAFEGSTVERILFPHGRGPELVDSQAEDLLKEMRDDPSAQHFKVVDTDANDKPIAFARWRFYYGDNARLMPSDPSQMRAMPGADAAGLKMWNEVVRRRRIEFIGGRPHCYLSNLVTDPEAQRRGAGSMLTRWGCEIADANGVPTFLQASPEGHRTYVKCGFDEAFAIDLDVASLGLYGECRTYMMVRHPPPASA